MLASYHGHAPLASLLVKHGADPNRLNDRGQSILAGAVFKNEPEVIDVLLEAGADPEIGQPTALDATRVSLTQPLLTVRTDKLTWDYRCSSRKHLSRGSRSRSRN